ncbi:MAG: PH domain-containing protein, partial [Verrucomicrobiota bacterium]
MVDHSAGTPPEEPGSATSPLGRLHPSTFILALVTAVFKTIVLGIFIATLDQPFRTVAIVWLITALLGVIQDCIRYFTLTYHFTESDFVIREGLFEKKERHIPCRRVQDVQIEQSFLQRLLQVCSLRIETAGSAEVEGSIRQIAVETAEHLRATIFERRAALTGSPNAIEDPSRPPPVPLREVTSLELLKAGLTSMKTGVAFGLISLAPSFGIPVPFDIEMPVPDVPDFLPVPDFLGEGLIRGLLYLGIGLFVAIAGYVVVFHRFTLRQIDDVLHREYGLLTRRTGTLSRPRIQLLRIDENLIRRWFGLAAMTIDTAGDMKANQEEKGRKGVFMPILPTEEIPGLVNAAFPDYAGLPSEWNRISPKAIGRQTRKGCFITLLLSTAFIPQFGWQVLWVAAFFPVIYFLCLMDFRYTGYQIADGYFNYRQGWLNRSTRLMPLKNLQTTGIR